MMLLPDSTIPQTDMQLAEKSDSYLKPGDFASISGIYQAIHVRHRQNHLVIILSGEELPGCRICKGLVRFALIEPLDHVTHDWDFAGPQLNLVKKGPISLPPSSER